MHSRSMCLVRNLLLVMTVAACAPKSQPPDTNGTVTPPPGTVVGVGVAGASGAAAGVAGRGGSTAVGSAGRNGAIGMGVAGRGVAGAPVTGNMGLAGMVAAAGANAAAGMGAAGAAMGAAGAAGSNPSNSHSGSNPVKFGKNIKLNDDSGRARQTEVALASGPNGMLIAGWMDERSDRTCSFSYSTDNGETWSKNVTIGNTANFVGDPAVAIDGGGNMYAICQQYITAGSSGNIKLMTSTDKGATWSPVSMIQSAPDKPWAGGGVESGTVFAGGGAWSQRLAELFDA